MNHSDHTPADSLITERGMAARLVDALTETDERLHSFDTFEDVGLMTRNTGIILRLDNGQEFQITVVEDERKRPPATAPCEHGHVGYCMACDEDAQDALDAADEARS